MGKNNERLISPEGEKQSIDYKSRLLNIPEIKSVLQRIEGKSNDFAEKAKTKKTLWQKFKAFISGEMKFFEFIKEIFVDNSDEFDDNQKAAKINKNKQALTLNYINEELKENNHFSKQLVLFATKNELEWKLYLQNMKEVFVEADTELITEEGETVKQLLMRFLKHKGHTNALKPKVNKLMKDMLKFGLPIDNYTFKKGTHVYLSKEGFVLEISSNKKDLKNINRTMYIKSDNTKEKKDIREGRLEYMKTYLKKGDIILMRGASNKIINKIARDEIEDVQKGFAYTHTAMYVGNGKVIHASPKHGVVEESLEKLMSAKSSNGHYIILENPLQNVQNTKESTDIAINYLRKQIGTKYSQIGLAAIAIKKHKKGAIKLLPNHKADYWNVCTGLLENAWAAAKLRISNKTVSPFEMFQLTKTKTVGDLNV